MPDGSSPDSSLQRAAALYRDHGGYVSRILRRCGVADDELEDAVQETFLVAYRRIDAFEGRAAARTWLYAIAIRVASTMRRSRRREDARREKGGADLVGSSLQDPEVVVGQHQAHDVLMALLDELDDRKRAVFVLADLEGLPIPEVAKILGLNVNTVHSRLRLARERFEVALGRHRAREQGKMLRARWTQRVRSEPVVWTEDARRQGLALLAVRLGAEATPGVWSVLAGLVPASLTAWRGFAGALVLGGVTLGSVALGRAVSLSQDHGVSSTAPVERRAQVAAGAVSSPQRRGPNPETHVAAPEAPVGPAPQTTGPVAEEGSAESPRITATAKRPREDATFPRASAGDPIAEETRMLEQARLALQQRDAQGALSVLDVHERRFPGGALAMERDSTRIHALCLAGRDTEATGLVEAWSRKRPDLPWSDVLAARCGAAVEPR